MKRAPIVLGFACAVGLFGLPGGPADAATAPPLLNSLEFPSNDFGALPQWRRVLSQMDEERARIAACDAEIKACPSTKVVAWRAKVQQLRSAYPLDQLREVNRYVNAWPTVTDVAAHGAVDHWATPLAFIERSGDSEDFAIFKFFMLRELGFDNDQLRIVIAQDTLRNRSVALVAAYHGGEVYLLDNVSDAVLRQERASHYVPFYSVNETTRWAHVVNAGDPSGETNEN